MDNAPAAWLLSTVRRLGQSRTSSARCAGEAPPAGGKLAAAFAWLLVVITIVLTCVRTASAAEEGDRRARATEVLEQAERDDEALALDRALAGYEEALRLDPSTSKAIRAERRAEALRARSEGGFAPFAALERVRRDPALASDARAVDDLLRAAETFPPGIVRVEVWVLVADAYAQRLDRPDDAIPLWRRIALDPHAEATLVQAAVTQLATTYLAREDYAAAEGALALSRPNLDEALAKRVHRAVRRHTLHVACVVVLGAVLLLAAIAIARAARAGALVTVVARTRSSGWLVLGYAAYVAIAGALLAAGYEEGTARPFLSFGAALAPLLVIARAWGAAGSPTRAARAGRAALSAASALAAAFLVLEHVDVSYLEGLGL